MPRSQGSLPKQGGWGGSPVVGCLLTLHLNSLSSNVLHRTVKFFYLLQLFNDTISIHLEIHHYSAAESLSEASQNERGTPVHRTDCVKCFIYISLKFLNIQLVLATYSFFYYFCIVNVALSS